MTDKDRSPSTGTFEGQDLACRRGGRILFRDLGFRVEPGGALALVGPNGSGKSSLLRLMAGLLAPVAGALQWNGRPVDDEHRGRLGYIGHLDAVKAPLTVREMLTFHARLQGSGGDPEAAARAFGLGAAIDLPGRYLSAGQRRRLSLARLLVAPRPLWLLDEPTVGLDEDGLAAFAALAGLHRRGGGMIVVSTHAALGLAEVATLRPAAFAPATSAPDDDELAA